MSKTVHRRFLTIAHEISPDLVTALQRVGPISLRRRRSLPIAETICRTIAGQQLSINAARTIWQRVVDSASDKSIIHMIESADEASLRGCGLSGAKIKAMKSVAEAKRAGLLEEKTLAASDSVARTKTLTAIWGVGQWTADMLNLFYFGEKDVWPNSDLAVTSTLQRLTSRSRKTENTARKFAPFRSYLAISLYDVVNKNLCPPC